jgi:hypothetical protein
MIEPRLMTGAEAAAYLGLTPASFAKWVADGRAPKPLPASDGFVITKLATPPASEIRSTFGIERREKPRWPSVDDAENSGAESNRK